METKKDNAKSTKIDKTAADGLSKKERRALKVKEKQKPETVAPQKTAEPLKVESAPKVLSEKEQRKLEWEKKLADQKQDKADEGGLSKAELKARRREQQDTQRLAKASQKEEPKTLPKQEEKKSVPKAQPQVQTPVKPSKKLAKPTNQPRKVQLITHLYAESLKNTQFERRIVNYKNVHPIFVKLGVQYATRKILGSNARCLALLSATKHLVETLQVPAKQEFCRYLESVFQSCLQYLQYCRPLSVSMTNASKFFKLKLQEATNLNEDSKKGHLLNCIQTYIEDEINKAGEAISLKVKDKITNGDVILTYGCSSLILEILLDAHKEDKDFEVIIVDGRPLLEGRVMLQRLVQAGIRCSYVQINALSYVMDLATKVLLGAHALLTNGFVMSRIGTAQVALVARVCNKPVLVCCETYKFSERVQTDAFVYNEPGSTDLLMDVDTTEETSPLSTSRDLANLQILNLLYDVTPPDLVTAIVTEIAILPCTSAPVVLRIKPTEFV